MILFQFLISLTSIVYFQAPPVLHDFHISKCNIEYKPDEASLQISLQMFIDDLEVALKEQGHDSLYIGTAKESELSNEFIEAYIVQKLKLKANEKELEDYSWIGKEISEDLTSLWCYIEIDSIEELHSLHLKNEILLEIFPDQKNINKILVPGHKQNHFMSQNGNNEKKLVYKSE